MKNVSYQIKAPEKNQSKELAEQIRILKLISQTNWDGGVIGNELRQLSPDAQGMNQYSKILCEVIAAYENDFRFRLRFSNGEDSFDKLLRLIHFFNTISKSHLDVYFDLLRLETASKIPIKEKKQILDRYFPFHPDGPDDMPF